MYSESMPKSVQAQMPYWSGGNRFSGSHNHSCREEAAETTGPQFPRTHQCSEIQIASSALLGVSELLPKSHSKACRNVYTRFLVDVVN